MRAVVFHQHGSVDQLRVESIPEPEIGPQDVLIRVRGRQADRRVQFLKIDLAEEASPLGDSE